MIRSSKHFFKDLNRDKKSRVRSFVQEYRRVAGIIVYTIWAKGYVEYNKLGEVAHEFNPQVGKYDLPKYLDYSRFLHAPDGACRHAGTIARQLETPLFARALSSLVTQLSGVLRAATAKQQRRLMVYQIKPNPKLKKAIERFKTSCPETGNLNPELSSKCVDFLGSESNKLHGHLRLKSLGSMFGSIVIPVVRHRHSKGFEQASWKLKNSFLISPQRVELRWKKEVALKKMGKAVGSDQGKTTVLTLSDGQATHKDCHGHDLASICAKLSRKEPGSKAFQKAQEHRQNYICWSLKQLNLTEVKELRYEDVRYLRQGRKTSAALRRFTYTLMPACCVHSTQEQVKNLCERNGVRFILGDSAFYSQRCCSCGWVQKSNRSGKSFHCRHCQFGIDADLNAAINHEQELPSARPFVGTKFNLNGFFWNPDGFFLGSGQALRVPGSPKAA